MRISIIITVIEFSFFITSCEKTITISQPDYQSKVSLQSMLEPDSFPIVYFNKTVPYFDNRTSFA
ncbi:MAG: hypothetical protein ABIT96_11790, partial [Ferruginibacter sp.]